MRKRAFKRAAASVCFGLALAAIAVLAGAPVLGVIAAVAGVGVGLSLLNRPGGVPILVYHSVSPNAHWLPWARNTSVRPETLRNHLEVLRKGGWTVLPTSHLIDARLSGTALPPRSVVLHFDDAYLDNILFAAPILREFQAPAMIFASTDFIAPGDQVRAPGPNPEDWQGYMNAAELRALDADPLFDIEAHGTNHARIPVSDTSLETLTAENWRRHAPLSWAHVDGDKSGWFHAETPPAPLQIGASVPENESALAGRWWQDGKPETEAAFAARVAQMLTTAQDRMATLLGRQSRVMAWPFDRCCDVSVAAAYDAGFSAVTGGRGENRADEDARFLARVHVQDRAFGGGPLWLEGLALRARVNGASGRWAWHLVTALAARLRKWRLGASGYGSVS